MNRLKKYLPIALAIGFFIFGLSAFLESKASDKNARIYKAVQQYSPYYLKKRFGGISILSKHDSEFKEKPTNMELFKELERLEKIWGQKHLKIENNTLIIVDNNQTQLFSLPLKSANELNFLQSYYGIGAK
ncbi:MAG: hypothetical protein QM493_07730 [Sulfurovum sp.]